MVIFPWPAKSVAATVALAAALVVGPVTAAARTATCSRVLSRAFSRYALKRWDSIARCERQKLEGLLAETVNCRPADGLVTDTLTAERLSRASSRLRSRVERRCSAPLPPVGSACDGAATAAELVDCLTAPAQEPDTTSVNVDTLVETVFGPGGPNTDAAERACVEGISRAVRTYLRRRAEAVRRCVRQAEAGKVAGTCPDAAAIEAFILARGRFATAARKHCGTAVLSSQDPPAFGVPCESYSATIYRRSVANGSANTIPIQDRLVRCMADATAAVAEKIASIPLVNGETGGFSMGVAAGDATEGAVIFWTSLPDPSAPAFLDVATDEGFSTIIQSLQVSAPAGSDGTVKVEVTGLSPSTTYYYRFRQAQMTSPTGQVKTAPAPGDTVTVRFGWSGDANAFFRPFGVLDILRHKDVDAWFFIGDTIYGDETRADGVEATTLAEYFAKHRLNRSDGSLRSLLATVGTYAQWDDHEVLNDFSGTVPAFADRMAAGNFAFRRYYPVREDPGDPTRLYRSFRWGTGVEFFLIDPRQYRSAKIVCCNPPDPPVQVVDTDVGLFGECPLGGQLLVPDAACNAVLADPSRTFLGAAQKAWLESGLLSSTATFKFIMNGPPVTQLRFQPYDRWEAYPVERAEILDFIETNNLKNVIWLSTDLHAIIISGERVDNAASHFVPEVVAGPVGVESIFREIVLISPDVLPLVPFFPALLPQVTEFDIDRFNVVVITIDESGSPPVARFEFLDRTGAVISTAAFAAVP